jgi:hypothetical protein
MLLWKFNVIFLMTGVTGYDPHAGATGSCERLDSITSGRI